MVTISIRENAYKPSSNQGRVLFAGDCLLSSDFDPDPVAEQLSAVIESSDHSIINFECPLESGEPIQKAGPILSNPEHAPRTLSSIGFDSITLANNHTMDYGSDGLRRTIEACTEAGLDTVGAGNTHEEALEPLQYSIQDTNIAVINACDREFGIADEDSPGTAWIGRPDIYRQVSRCVTEHDIVFAVVHGGIEYAPIPPIEWQRQLRGLVDAGVDAVVGHHPHVAQGWEVYDGAPIFYSTGNFLFRNPNRSSTEWTYIVQFTVSQTSIQAVNLILTEYVNGQIQPMGSIRQPAKHANYLERLSEITEELLDKHGYWQEIASRFYREQQYHHRLARYGDSFVESLVSDPVSELKRIAKRNPKNKETDIIETHILNYFQNRCHSEVARTALLLRTGAIEDQRTEEIIQEVDELLGWTDAPDSS